MRKLKFREGKVPTCVAWGQSQDGALRTGRLWRLSLIQHLSHHSQQDEEEPEEHRTYGGVEESVGEGLSGRRLAAGNL